VGPPVDLGLLVVGEINPDIIVSGAHAQPRFGQAERYVRSIRLAVGSSSVITACGATRLGLRTAFVGVVGDDLFGRFMLDEMRTRGIDVSACRIDPELPTGVTVVLDAGADRAILTAPGAMASLHAEDVPLALLMRARHLHVGSWFLQDRLRPGLPGLFAAAHAEGLTTSLDPGWDPAEEWQGLQDILALTDVFLPNTAEARAIGGTSDVAAAAQAIRGVGPEGMTVVVKQADRGALAVRGSASVTSAALQVTVADAVGAGDSFDAGFLCGYLQGWPLADALELAVACGALSTRRAGGTDGQPTLEEARAALLAAGRDLPE